MLVEDDPLLALTGSFTLEAYINLAALPATGIQWQILFRGDSRGGLDPYYLDVWDGQVRFTINAEPTGGARVAAAAPALNQWTHIAGVLDDTTGLMSLYFDGVLADSTITTLCPFATLDPTMNPGLSIGGYPATDYFGPFRGYIDEVRISDVALAPRTFSTPPSPSPNPPPPPCSSSASPVSRFASAGTASRAATTYVAKACNNHPQGEDQRSAAGGWLL